MIEFMNKDFLLTTDTAKHLYHDVAAKMPIIDYHCHLVPQEIYEDRKFENLSQVWLGADHYKWRALRTIGATEDKVTGNAPDIDKYHAFAEAMPQLIGNPIYHWSHLELQRGFDIYEPLTPKTAGKIYEEANEKLKDKSARSFMEQFGVRAVCTTDDPADDLIWHEKIKADSTMKVKILPAFRPDRAINIEKPDFLDYMKRLESVVGHSFNTTKDVADALLERIDYFAAHGCLCADHGLDRLIYAKPDPEAADRALRAVKEGRIPEESDAAAYKTLLMCVCAKRYTELGWVMQIHFGCLRNTNKPMFRTFGPDGGFDAINSDSGVSNLAPMLNEFLENDGLPKMILYSLNGNDNMAIASIMGCFQGGGVAGKMQLGSAWWFNDTMQGMQKQLIDLASSGVLGQFVGMLTDSRSFLSYPRHEYFRRILCQLIGEWVESGQYPNDMEYLEKMVEDICFNNTNKFFGFNV